MHSILSSIIKLGVFLIVCLPFSAQLQNLTANTSINITKVEEENRNDIVC